MTSDERRARTKHVATMVEQGILVEPPEDREKRLRAHVRDSDACAALPPTDNHP